MAISEFELINKYFTSNDRGEGISLGIGDDCALINIPQNFELAITTDTQNEGIHFFKDTSPFYLGYKSLLVNVSDLAAMGAKPYCFTLSINLPEATESFLKEFSEGLYSLASKLNLPLIGGNTTKGPLSITISAYGIVEKGLAMKRSCAKIDDGIYVTGTLGLPAFAVDLGYKTQPIKNLMERLSLNKEYESIFNHCYKKGMLIEPRCKFSVELAKLCSCAIDISDGFVGDLRHILKASDVGAKIDVDALPRPQEFSLYNLPHDYQDHLCLFGGGDYELIFTMDVNRENELYALSKKFNVPVKRVGTVKKGSLDLLKNGNIISFKEKPFEHF